MTGTTYLDVDDVQAAIDQVVKMAEAAESANRHAMSSWYGSICEWIRKREQERLGFTLTLPDEAGDLIILEVPGGGNEPHEDPVAHGGP